MAYPVLFFSRPLFEGWSHWTYFLYSSLSFWLTLPWVVLSRPYYTSVIYTGRLSYRPCQLNFVEFCLVYHSWLRLFATLAWRTPSRITLLWCIAYTGNTCFPTDSPFQDALQSYGDINRQVYNYNLRTIADSKFCIGPNAWAEKQMCERASDHRSTCG